ncbi:hypothetical protein LSUB1_G008687, partial [Lachnellula subtilissima]
LKSTSGPTFYPATPPRRTSNGIKSWHMGSPLATKFGLLIRILSPENRARQTARSIAIAFATPEEASAAIRNRLYIAGILVRCKKHYITRPTAQCIRCQRYSHLLHYYHREASYAHLILKCANYGGPYTASLAACEALAPKSSKPSLDITPRTIAYIARSYRPRVALASESPYDSDFQVLDIIDQDHTIKVYNIYNEKHQLPNSDTRTLARCLWQLIPPLDSVFCRDFNAHNPWWDPLYKARDIEGITLADWIDHYDLALLNTPGIGTFHRSHMARPTNIDLTLAYRSIANHIQDWAIIEDIGSDHLGIVFTIQGSQIGLADPQTTRFNTKRAN